MYRIGIIGLGGKELLLKTDGLFKDSTVCNGCDCCNPCEWAEFPTESGAMAYLYDKGIEDAFIVNTKNNQRISI